MLFSTITWKLAFSWISCWSLSEIPLVASIPPIIIILLPISSAIEIGKEFKDSTTASAIPAHLIPALLGLNKSSGTVIARFDKYKICLPIASWADVKGYPISPCSGNTYPLSGIFFFLNIIYCKSLSSFKKLLGI